MRLAVVILILAAVVATASASEVELQLPAATYLQMFKSFITKFRRTFSAATFNKKLEVFKRNVDKITALNKASRGVKYVVNNLADLSEAEYRRMLGTRRSGSFLDIGASAEAGAEADAAATADQHTSEELHAGAPTSFDWTNVKGKNHLQGVVDQTPQCGSCWAFATAALLESHLSIKFGINMKLSEQALLSCSGAGDCNGGTYTGAMDSIRDGKTQMVPASKYPYKMAPTPNICAAVKSDPNAVKNVRIRLFERVTGSDADFADALAKNGPIAVTVDGGSLQFYGGGIEHNSNCTGPLNHGVVLVGYGSNNEGKFWKVRNSHGPEWGINGYFLLARNGQNTCGVRTMGAVPQLRKV